MAYKSTQEVARLLTDFAEFVSQGIVFVDLKGTICFANTAWLKMHGYAASEEITGKHISICYTQQKSMTDMQHFIEEVRQKGCFEGCLEHIRTDGSSFQTQARIIILRASSKEVGYAVFATDLSESKRFEQLLAELTLANQQLQEQVAELCLEEQSLTPDLNKMDNEKLNYDVGGEQSEEVFSINEKPLFDPEKLKYLSDLAKRLAVKKEMPPGATERIPIKEFSPASPQRKPRSYEVIELINPPCSTENLSIDEQ
jgi:PAS domain S-box-containing protein